jgi:dihydropteroate synthase
VSDGAEGSTSGAASWLLARGRRLPLEPWAIMGIVNVTPDSFSDGGDFTDAHTAASHALVLAEEGAAIIDVGGESTRPGAERVSADEQIRRVVPAIEAIRRASDIPISIDTTLAAVARAALDAGADAVNDVSAAEEDEAMLALVADRGCGIVLMHRIAPPDRDRYSTELQVAPISGDIVEAVRDDLLAAAHRALSAGIARESIALDPGLGFGKTVEQNWALIARSGELADLGYALLIGASRKSFIGRASGVAEPARRVVGSAVAAAIAWSGGARIIRTHDVAAAREALGVASAAIAATAHDGQAEHD